MKNSLISGKSAAMDWVEISILVNAETKDSITNRLFELGAEGVTESGTDGLSLLGYFKKDLSETVLSEMKIYWESLKQIFPAIPELKISSKTIKNENWAERYKEYYFAQKLSELFFLRPIWDQKTPIPNGMYPIFMEPGQAFGTGLHNSTRLCLKMIESLIIGNIHRTQLNCLDVGTGTGILAIVAEKLGVHSVLGIDNDPIAVEVAQENLVINHCKKTKMADTDIRKITANYDLVISNILLETHRELAQEYARLVKMGGNLVLSGLLGYQRSEILEIMKPQGFHLLEARNAQEWGAFLFIRRDWK